MRLFLLLLFALPSLCAGELVREANTTLSLPAAAPVETGFQLVNALGELSFTQPLDIDSPPGDTRHLFVVEKTGRIQRVTLPSPPEQPEPLTAEFFDIRDISSSTAGVFQSGGERGLLSMAFHPDYATNGFVYIFYSFRLSDFVQYQRVARLTAVPVNGSYLQATSIDSSSMLPLITQRDQQTNHNGGDLHFGPDGYLYISVGDEGGARDSFNNSNFINKDFHSAILRIDVDNLSSNSSPNPHTQSGSITSAITPNSYRIPNDNPFITATEHQGISLSGTNVRTEIWVAGLRNPFRFSFDPATGRCFIADVGQGAREEINLVSGGEDCGWSRREGNIAHNAGPAGSTTQAQLDAFNFHEPIQAYPRSDGSSITGGIVYRGSRISELFGHYIFTDYNSGRFWSLSEQADGSWTRQQLLTQNRIAGFGVDPSNNDLLCCNLSSGEILRLVRASASNAAPQRLSETGAFSQLQTLTPHTGIYGYDVNLPFWSDHATKKRWFSIPDGSSTMTFSEKGSWDFPTGQIWIKHFDLEMERGNPATSRKLETRFIVKTATGAYGLSYRWRADGSDADLIGPDGLNEDLQIIENGSPITQTWQYPSRNDCMTCHLPSNNYALSFHSPQLNRPGTLGSDQIDALACAGFLNTSPPVSRSIPAHPALEDNSVSREARVRAYLDVNCAMCHRQDVAITPANFDTRLSVRTDASNLIRGLLSDSLGDPDNRVITPGDSDHSALLTRLSNGPNRMPPLASTEEDVEAIALIRDWIENDLTTRQSYSEWSISQLGSVLPMDGDADGDGDSNQLEFLTGTDPEDSTSRFRLDLTGTESLTFLRPANRRLLIEESSDLLNWRPLLDPNNALRAPAAASMQTLDLPERGTLFLRARVEAP